MNNLPPKNFNVSYIMIADKYKLSKIDFARLLKFCRESKQWKQVYLANKIGISRQQLSAYENAHELPCNHFCKIICDLLPMETMYNDRNIRTLLDLTEPLKSEFL